MSLTINAFDDASRDYLYNLSNIYLKEFSEEDIALTAEMTEDGENVTCTAFISIGTEKGSYTVTLSVKDHFTFARLKSLSVGVSFFMASRRFTDYKAPFGILTGVRPAKIAYFYLVNGVSEEKCLSILEELYFLNKEKAAVCVKAAKHEFSQKKIYGDSSCGVYISIPFCPTRCSYCSFISSAAPKQLKLIPDYLHLLEEEISELGRICKDSGVSPRSFYVGGGTPGILTAEQITSLLTKVNNSFDMSDVTEVTFELGRPDTVSEDKLCALIGAGVNRLCVNTQTTSDDVLKKIGRAHTAEDFFRAYELSVKAGFKNINVDLIAGLTGDTIEGFIKSIDEVSALSPANLTVHTLCMKRASEETESGITAYGEKDEISEMISYSEKKLSSLGYEPYYLYRQKNAKGNYENTGYALNGNICAYNVIMMEDVCTVLSAGAGAVTKILRPGKSAKRFSSFKYPYEYINQNEKVRSTLSMIEEELLT